MPRLIILIAQYAKWHRKDIRSASKWLYGQFCAIPGPSSALRPGALSTLLQCLTRSALGGLRRTVLARKKSFQRDPPHLKGETANTYRKS